MKKKLIPLVTWDVNIVDTQRWLDKEYGISDETYYKVKSIVLFGRYKFPVCIRDFKQINTIENGRKEVKGFKEHAVSR